jgi:hypothetical protein
MAIKPLRPRGSANAIRSTVQHKVTPNSPENARRVPVKQARAGKSSERSNLYNVRTLQHGEIMAAGRGGSSYYAPGRACLTKVSGEMGTRGARRGQVELLFLPRGIPVSKYSTRPPGPGPALRFCSKVGEKGFAQILAVRDPREAKEIAVKFQACAAKTSERTTNLEACVVEATGKRVKDLPFGAGQSRRADKVKAKPPIRRRKVERGKTVKLKSYGRR